MCLSGNYSYTTVAKKFNTNDSTLRNWTSTYKNNGVDGLQESHTWRKYLLELKLAAVNDYLLRKFSLSECCDKYNILSNSVLRKWISKYNSGKELKATNGGPTRMKAGVKQHLKKDLKLPYTLLNMVKIILPQLRSIVSLINKYILGLKSTFLKEKMD